MNEILAHTVDELKAALESILTDASYARKQLVLHGTTGGPERATDSVERIIERCERELKYPT